MGRATTDALEFDMIVQTLLLQTLPMLTHDMVHYSSTVLYRAARAIAIISAYFHITDLIDDWQHYSRRRHYSNE